MTNFETNTIKRALAALETIADELKLSNRLKAMTIAKSVNTDANAVILSAEDVLKAAKEDEDG